MTSPAAAPLEIVSLPAEGMTCASCVNRITRFLGKAEGAEEAHQGDHHRLMNIRPVLLLATGALALLLVRRDLVVRAIRAIDQHGGLTSRRGERVYAGASRLFSGLHHRVARDVAAVAASGAITVLDIGAGPGSLLLEVASLAPAATLVGVEPSASMRAIAAARGLTEVDGRAERLPLPDASVDLVVSTLSMHHWDDPARALAEIRRVLRPGGQARLYDIRIAAYSDRELHAFAVRAGLDPGSVVRSTFDERLLGLYPYSLITFTAPRSQ